MGGYKGFPSLGDLPEDSKIFWRDFVKETLGFLPNKPLDVLLRDFGEIFTMNPQTVVPAFAKPFKQTTPPDGVELPPEEQAPPPPETYVDVVTFDCPVGQAAVVTSVHQELESLAAYADVGVRLLYRGASDEWWYPQKPESSPVRIVLFEKERISIQFENTSEIITHYAWAEILGYTFPVNKPSKNQYGLRVDIGSSKQG